MPGSDEGNDQKGGKQQEGQKSEEKPDSSGGPQVGTRYSAEEIHENIVQAADEEMDRPAMELSFSGFSSGLSIGFSFLAVAVLSARMSPDLRDIAAAIAYPLGFVFVVLARHQLFTENTLEPVIPLLERHDAESFAKVMRLWGIVLPSNLLGALVFAFVVSHTQVLEPSLNDSLRKVAEHSYEGGPLLVFYKAIWAGWLIALMAWLISSTRETIAQLALIWITTAPIAGFGFKHSIAGAAEAFYLFCIGQISFADAWLSFELPALAGNIIGGVVLVALLNHGQVGASKSS